MTDIAGEQRLVFSQNGPVEVPSTQQEIYDFTYILRFIDKKDTWYLPDAYETRHNYSRAIVFTVSINKLAADGSKDCELWLSFDELNFA